jgi:hypothetical protein
VTVVRTEEGDSGKESWTLVAVVRTDRLRTHFNSGRLGAS